jgi:serine/threonine protein phosphatase PrpC
MRSFAEEDRLWARNVETLEFNGKSKNDLSFFECDYIIRCVDGPYEGRQFRMRDLGNEFSIGSNESCNFFLKDHEVSGLHCKISYVENSFYYVVEDSNSENGTWIKISSMEEGFEVKEPTIFSICSHTFTIFQNDEGHVLEFLKGPMKDFKQVIADEENILLGKKDCKINLEMNLPDNHIYRIVKTKGRVFVINETQEFTCDGLLYKLSNGSIGLIRAGDSIKIGRCLFRILVHNWGIFSEIGDRTHMEDKFCMVDDLRIFDDVIVPYYAIYDGHGGISCSQYLQKNFHNNLKKFLKHKDLTQSDNFIPDFCQAIQDVIIYTDMQYAEVESNFSIHHGSTCVSLFFIGNKVLCCNLGDSISVLVKNDMKKVYLSRDFKPTREKERVRITKKNGYISNDGRLLGIISVSRAFGDWKFKDKKKQVHLKKNITKTEEFDEYLISNRAEFKIIDIDTNEDQYIIIASDGIFQHCSNNNQLFKIINEYLSVENTENSNIKNIPYVVDNVRLHMINNIYGDNNMKGKADNMTLILIHLQNNKN